MLGVKKWIHTLSNIHKEHLKYYYRILCFMTELNRIKKRSSHDY